MFRISIFVIIGFTVSLFAQDIEDKTQESYHIETVVKEGTACEPKEIRFVSPDGDIVKVLPAWKDKHPKPGIRYLQEILVSKNCKYALQKEESVPIDTLYRETIKGADIPLKLTYYNAEGKVLWKKELTVWFYVMAAENFGCKVSCNGEAVLFLRNERLESREFEIQFYVFDTLGNEIIKTTYVTNFIPAWSEISPDGKIVSAKVYNNKEGTGGLFFFFLDVETGRTKVVKGEGEGWRGFPSLTTQIPTSEGYKYLPSRHIKIRWKINGKKNGRILSFDEIPEDLSILFGKEEKQESKIELIPVYEKTFVDSIVDVIFDTATVSIEEAKKMGWKDKAFSKVEKRKGKAKIEYPKVVMVANGKGIKFYDKTGRLLNTLKVKKQQKYEEVYTSPNGKYVLISKIPGEYDYAYSGGTLYDCEGKKICEINGPTPIAVSDEGYTVAAYLDWQVPPEPGGSFYIYNPSGKLIKTIENPDKEKTAPLFAKYSKDGEYAILVFKATTFPPTVIYFIKKTGEIMWKKEFPEYRFSARDEEIDLLSNEGIAGIFDLVKILPLGEEDWKTFLFYIDWQGNLMWKFPLEIRGNMIVGIAESKKKVYVVSTEGYIWCIESAHGGILWKHKEPWSPDPSVGKPWRNDVPLFIEIRIRNNTLYIIGKNMQDFSSTLFVFDTETGNLLKMTEYPQEEIMFAETTKDVNLINTAKGRVSILKKVLK